MTKAIKIGSRREVCWDEYLLDQAQGIRVQMHRPEFRNVALECDAPWEGNTSGYFTLVPDETYYRLYYRGSQMDVDHDGERKPAHKPMYCCAQSKDGKTFTRVPVNESLFWGSRENNIITDTLRDNMYVFRDSNPDCPPDARYKGLAEAETRNALWYYKSSDGIHFTKVGILVDDGAYDSLNPAFWDEETKQYFLFYRGLHGEHKGKGRGTEEYLMHTTIIRDVRVRTSRDFENWSEPRMIEFDPKREDTELYTNQIQKYYRARHMFLGFPTRYVDRYADGGNFPKLPDWKHRQKLIRGWGRVGTAMTDAMIMTSRDGFTFRRTEEAFLTPGIERDCNWYYGDCFLCYGMAETASEIPGAPREISLYMGLDFRVNPVKLCRYAIRLDGFFSWHCDYEPGRVVTKPLIFSGNSLEINFATSAAGYVRIRLLNREGNFLEGYDSGRLFGDSVERMVEFEEPLEKLAGKEICMEFSMKDAELYAFQFSEVPAL